MKKTILLIIILVLILTAAFFWYSRTADNSDTTKFVAETDYSCDSGKQIKADYFEGQAKPVKTGEMPIPSGKVELVLSDGRHLILPQTISASGIRYANSDESIIFWSKGEGAFIVENNVETYSNCAQRVWTLGNEQLDQAVRNFLLSQKEFSWGVGTGSKNFCIFQNLAPEKELFPHYLWVRCGEFKMEAGQLKELSGMSAPIKLDYPNELSYYDLSKFSFAMPRDGSLYDKDVKIIFPEEIQNRLHFETGPLNERIKQEAQKYFEQNN